MWTITRYLRNIKTLIYIDAKMAGFLASFKSEYRTFKHESSTQDVSEYGEPIQKVGLQKDIKGILSKKKYRDGYGLAR